MTDVLSAVERRRASLVGLLATLVRAPSVNPPGDTRAVAEVVARRLRDAAVDFQVLADEPRKPNILARIGAGRPQVLYLSHMDTVPPGDLRAWRHDPFAAEVVGTRLFGRGAADAKASLAAMLGAVEVLAAAAPLRGTLVFAAVSDEEVGGVKGTEFLVDRGLLRADQVVVGELTGNRVAIAEKGLLWVRLVTHGRAAHASTPWEGSNAISQMIRVLLAVEERAGARLRDLSHPLVPPPSLSIGTIRGGVAVNIVPDWCEATLDRRTLPGESVAAALAEIERVVADLRAADPSLQVDVEVLQSGAPIETPVDSPLVRTAREAARRLHLPDEPVGYPQASDGRFFAERGIPTILFGPGDPDVSHTPDEFVDLNSMITAAQFLALLGQMLLAPTVRAAEEAR
ncbi:MAG: M20 family metallopeptidase [Armatimonadota bacterium]|nr:M20 family metallopeptidase [Armatimonadota bacterium]MDR7403700.1 M20 family metallopeptidase [Armatimonadota bacterium]